MKASRFNVTACLPHTGEVALYNTLYGALTIWERSEFHEARRFLSGDPVPTVKQVGSQSALTQLKTCKYITPDNVDELDIVRRRKRCGMEDPNRLDIVLLPNLYCNFRCSYCYERHRPTSFMNDTTEASIKRFLEKNIARFKLLMLLWFGGEPLLTYNRVVSLTSFARSLCSRHRVELITNITTNAYLLDETKIKELIRLGIHNFQITVDGPPGVHNKMRPLRTGLGSFEKIFHNIQVLVRADRRVRVSLRVNFNHINLGSIPRLLQMFPQDIRPALRVVYEPIFGPDCLSATSNIADKTISSRLAKYYALAQNLGYDVIIGGIGAGRLVYCYGERLNQYVIAFNGDVYKCTVGTFDSKDRLGYLSNDGEIVLNEKWKEWFDLDPFDKRCGACKFLPLCMGGCRKARLETGMTGTYCKLTPTTTSYILKTVALGGFDQVLQRSAGKYTGEAS